LSDRPRKADRRVDVHTTLIGAEKVAAHLGDPGWVVVDCRFTVGAPQAGETAWAKSRIPGARYAHLERDLSGPRGAGLGRNPLPDPATFAATLARWGIGPATQVVAYDDSFGSIACRLWWLLRCAGHPAVALLDGGWPVWVRRKHPVDASPVAAVASADPVAGRPGPVVLDPAWLADTPAVERIRDDPAWALLDARPEERFSGEREEVDPIAGHIPGARFATFEDNLAFDGTFLPPAELRQRFAALCGGVAPERVVHTCGSGVTACHNLLAMEHAGLHGSRLHAGSWSEWITDPTRPVATGME
jgi:thiosulfate/3-mercaptopyruvate sulfurtransferase